MESKAEELLNLTQNHSLLQIKCETLEKKLFDSLNKFKILSEKEEISLPLNTIVLVIVQVDLSPFKGTMLLCFWLQGLQSQARQARSFQGPNQIFVFSFVLGNKAPDVRK